MTARAESQKLLQSAVIELIDIEYQGQIIRLTNGTKDELQLVSFAGNVYDRRQFAIEGYQITEGGTLPRPRLDIDNVDGYWYSIVRNNNDLKMANITYRKVYRKNLDDGTEADSTEILAEYQYEVRQRSAINPQNLTLILGVPLDSEQLRFGIQALRNTCPRDYRVPDVNNNNTFFDINSDDVVDCPYVGNQYFKEDDTPTADYLQDSCSRTLNACRLRFGEDSLLPFRGIPSIGKSRQ